MAEDLDVLEKQRTQVRRFHSNLSTRVADALVKVPLDEIELETELAKLELRHNELQALDDKILKLIVQSANEDALVNEYNTADEYVNAYVNVKTKYLHYMKTVKLPPSHGNTPVLSTMSGVQGAGIHEADVKEQFNLPRMEIRSFDGSPKDWLAFWSQFRRIHDRVMDDGDKMLYLYQFTKGKARKIVEGYPQHGDSYKLALEQIKERFASDRILSRYYMGKIFSLVLKAAGQGMNVESLYTDLDTQLRALRTLKIPAEKYSEFLCPFIEASLSDETLLAWQRYRSQMVHAQNSNSNSDAGSVLDPDLCEDELEWLLTFLRSEVDNIDRIREVRETFPGENKKGRQSKERSKDNGESVPTAAVLANSVDKTVKACIFCDGTNHVNQDCYAFRKLGLLDKRSALEKAGACFRCFNKGHLSTDCPVKVKCIICLGKHHVLLCAKLPDPEAKGDSKDKPRKSIENLQKSKDPDEDKGKRKSKQNEKKANLKEQENISSSVTSVNCVYLFTLLVEIESENGSRIVRAMVDDGSQRSFLLKSVVDELKLEPVGEECLSNCLFGDVKVPSRVHRKFSLKLAASDFRCEMPVLEEERIISSVPRLSQNHIEEFPSIEFSDCGKPDQPIELLIGLDNYALISTGKEVISEEGLVAKETKFGWMLGGKRRETLTLSYVTTCLRTSVISDLWDLDVLGIRQPEALQSKEDLEKETLEHFNNHTIRLNDGRYEIELPWIRERNELENNLSIAKKRLERVSVKFDKYLEDYGNVLSDWEQLGIIEEVCEATKFVSGHFLPHRPVVTLHKETTKIRPVFDASAHRQGKLSLNDCLSPGPNLLESIIPLVNRFRMNEIGLVADIEKAFLQISISQADREFLKFLWTDPEGNLKVFQHKRLVFGVTCSPFILNATISKHLDEFEVNEFASRETVEKLKESFYVDDCVTSVKSSEELNKFVAEASFILKKACFNLRGWTNTSGKENESDANIMKSVLGLKWNISDDTLSCDSQIDCSSIESISKRKLLSIANKIFDPLGFYAPVLLIPKLILQEVWGLNLKWDEVLPDNLLKKVDCWINDLNLLQQCWIPRWIGITDHAAISIHVFCDASIAAYATCIFVRVEAAGAVRCHLLMAKARVAPLKRALTVPKLELMGALIGVRLYSTIQKIFGNVDTYFWTDSTIVLTWIKLEAPWAPFVKHRVDEILQVSKRENWFHVSGTKNPADLPSRGCFPKEFLKKEWWNGPEWLQLDQSEWGLSREFLPNELAHEERRKAIVMLKTVSFTEEEKIWSQLINNISKYTWIIRSLAWIRRFIFNLHVLRNKDLKRRIGELDGEEIEFAEITLLKFTQKEFSPNDFKRIKVVEDDNGLLRVETRILDDDHEEGINRPIVLPSNSELVTKLILEHHELFCHANVLTLAVVLRQRFWILKARQTIKKAIKTCVDCKKLTSQSADAPTGLLPKDRFRLGKVFNVVGVDLAGPLYLRNNNKVWICLYTCSVYRAVHLEIVESMSTESFLLAFRRFIARRGRPSTVHSDNGTNFIGAANLLNHQYQVLTFCSIRKIKWKFNPPTASWWGGYWERLVGVVKLAVKKCLGKACLKLEELQTLICEVEAVVNSRPLTYVSEDPGELIALTPAYFLQDNSDCNVCDLDTIDAQGLRKRGRYIAQVREHLRIRFFNSYIVTLAERKKSKYRPIKVGDVVLVSNDNKKRIDWPLGLVVSMTPGRDGICRLFKVKTAKGTFDRPLQRLYPLEISAAENSNPGESEVNEVVESINGNVPEPVPSESEKLVVNEPISKTVPDVIPNLDYSVSDADEIFNSASEGSEAESPKQVVSSHGRRVSKNKRYYGPEYVND